jgi:HD-like signal output (HDOD) protein
MGELSEVIQYDPGLTVNILRIANSSYFGAVRTIGSLREAIIRLGANRIFQLVIAVGVAPYSRQAIRGYGLEPGELLENSVAVALSSELLAKELGIDPPPHTFTSGLLVNIGKIVLGTFLEEDAGPILALAEEKAIPFHEAEREVLGIDHAEVGAALLEHWKLPEAIVTVVRHRLSPESYEGVDLALDLVHCGDMIAKASGQGAGIDGTHYLPSVAVTARLGINPNTVHAVLFALPSHVAELRDIFMRSQ